MRKIFLMSLFVCSTLCYAQKDDPFGLYKKDSSKSNNYDLEKVYEVKERPKPFIGLNVGIGGDFGRGFSTLEGSIGLDMAGSIKDNFAMGCYLSYQTITAVSLGLLFIHGNHNKNHAFLWGIGYSSSELTLNPKLNELGFAKEIKISPNLRLGFVLKNGFYFMADMEVSEKSFVKEHGDCPYHTYVVLYKRNSYDVNLRIGYKFNLTKKKN